MAQKDDLLNIIKAEMNEIIRNCEIHNYEAIPMDLLNQGLPSQEDEDEEIILDSITVRPIPIKTDSGEATEVKDLQEESLSKLNSPNHSKMEIELEYETDHIVGGFNAGKAPGSTQAPVNAVLKRAFTGLSLRRFEPRKKLAIMLRNWKNSTPPSLQLESALGDGAKAERYEAAFTAQTIAENLLPLPKTSF